MRFYVPEWDDAVDAHYDFEHDELSTLDRQERDLNYIWDIFEPETTPIDGVLISREQVEETDRKADRLAKYGVYDDPVLSVPNWLPTISDCGAWGYKSLPFPPYGNEEMLSFYKTLKVTVGVTIDHLVLGSGKEEGRLYLNERAFDGDMTKDDIPDAVTEVVDVMTDEWPEEWPAYVDEYEPTIRTDANSEIEPFTAADFQGEIESVLERLSQDPRAVYREDDAEFRYELTLRNAQEMYALYQRRDYPFRLMVAVQGWDSDSYARAAEEVLDIGYDYLGIGGVAGSPIHDVREIVKAVGKTVKAFERDHNTRVDSHVFGFAKTEGFETIGRSGMSSFDSASMLRSAWTGGGNYRLDHDERYDAIRVRYPSSSANIAESVEASLRSREVLVALRAYDAGGSIRDALNDWHSSSVDILPAVEHYLREHRHDNQFDERLLEVVEAAFREDFEYGRELQASFGGDLRRKLAKLLREDGPEDPVPFSQYSDLLKTADEIFDQFPHAPVLLNDSDIVTDYDRVWAIVREYATWVGDDDLLEEYQETLRERPWDRCDCPLCREESIDICIFRGNDRNRRRGFHNTRRFYDEFEEDLPKILVATKGTAKLSGFETVENYLRDEHPEFWEQTHDLPIAELGMLDASGVNEWWDDTPSMASFDPDRMAANIGEQAARYQYLFLQDDDGSIDDAVIEAAREKECAVETYSDPADLREQVLETCGENYVAGEDFLPHPPELDVDNLDILVIDQCSGSKDVPDNAPVFDADETLQFSREDLLARDNVPGIAARDLYTGRQQANVRDAVRRLRSNGHDVDRYFISAGFGLVGENDYLPPYEVTFSSMNVSEIRDRSGKLYIQEDLQKVLDESDYDVVFFTLSKDYYTSIDVDKMVQRVKADRIGVVFNRELVEDQFDNIESIPARTEDAKRHGTIVIGLKGLYMKNFAKQVDNLETIRPETIEELCRYVDDGPNQTTLPQEKS
ncbi:queuine tRNA-ribosyltransferase tRNA-guanine transglycosylase [Halobaculum marinum]|uniref:Queuine tRNA-ribosyltransferase tRNA-guanine transglycosylase n=1 Tax=Halobaculum marinum TaxID=3031996 RepID=A0ABD5WTY3_9EURY|nr:queuine tRNA-ribosyltransferase tRNA-guanine transglycosylase [Halobaculum sp. DT55]